jgi:hypothetical protein
MIDRLTMNAINACFSRNPQVLVAIPVHRENLQRAAVESGSDERPEMAPVESFQSEAGPLFADPYPQETTGVPHEAAYSVLSRV